MKILASADIHGDWSVYEWLLDVAADQYIDAIVLAGDLLGCPDGFDTPEDAQRHESEWVNGLLAQSVCPVLYIMGNDDLIELDSSSEYVESIQGRRVDLGNFSFVGYQYSLPFMGGTFEKPDNEIEADLVAIKPLISSNTVVVTHSPAFGILDPGFVGARIGSKSIQYMLESTQFLAHVHGHSHAGFGRCGQHFNVASACRQRAVIIDLVTMKHDSVGQGSFSDLQ
jgi:Icc-related predicted phosphoesterase